MLIVYIAIAAVVCIFAVDIVLNGITWLKRLKIGRWEDRTIWYNKVYNIAYKWYFYKTPVVKKTDQSRYLLLDMLKGNYKNSNIQSWQIGGLYLGLSEYLDKTDSQIMEMQNKWIDSTTGKWREQPKEVDGALLAYAILRKAKNPEAIKSAMDYMYELILKRIQDEDGCVCYRLGLPSVRFVDTVGFICPFLALYGKVFDNQDAIDLSLNQIKTYYKYGILKPSIMAGHAYETNNNTPLGIYGWGRGSGWWLIGIIDTYLELTEVDWLKELIKETADSFAFHQTEQGGFSSILQLKNNIESSVTAITAYFYKKCYDIFNEARYKEISEKCICTLMRNTRRNGEIDFSQGDTKGIGIYSTVYDIMPFTQGIAIRGCEEIW